ncbi:MAG: aminoacyl-histidine dipeptidase [Clostridia bacterium]|nr:aminoacyl-histidine dipeptidase [Clostridia bacterium]
MAKLTNLLPERVFHYFEEICSIPHGSGDTAKISDYCVEFAKSRGLEFIKEDIGNVIIKKPASLGKENCEPIVLQGHLDMVCEKAEGVEFDFTKDSLKVDCEGDYVFAHGTTLGGDDGIAVAMCMALLEDDSIAHPPIEVLFTVDEETGMYGAQALVGDDIKGRRLINIDSEEEGVFTVSCAGGVRAELSISLNTEINNLPCYNVTLDGLIGGHSGVEIHKGRLNSNKAMAAFLSTLNDCRLISINGGMKDNAIPVLTRAVVATNEDISRKAADFVKHNATDSDPDLNITVLKAEKCEVCFTKKDSERAVDFLCGLPNGIIKWSDNIDNLVETSLNLGVLLTENNKISASFALRSSVNEDKLKLLDDLKEYVAKFDGKMLSEGHYPAWEYRKESPLRDIMCKVYEQQYGALPQVVAIHAGLECGLLSEKLNGLDAVSMGPNMYDIHTCRERLSISSVEKLYSYICKLLECL